jgi:hypothetical protein
MLDRLAFLASRGFGPLGNLATLFLVGLAFGRGAIGDYTYALAICGPVYFLVTFSLPTYIAVEPQGTSNRPEVFWVRIITLAASLLLAIPLAFAPDPRWAATGALWVLKSGDVLFDPVIAFTATDGSSTRRGLMLARMEGIRVGVVQVVLLASALTFHATLPVSLVLAGAAHISIAGYFFLRIGWTSLKCQVRAAAAVALRIGLTSLPMTLSGVLLAALVGLPRLLLDSSLQPEERTLVGLAQVAGSVMALLFNAGWMYELSVLKRTAESGDLRKLIRHNLKLSLVYLAFLTGASLLVLATPTWVWQRARIGAHGVSVLAATMFVLGFPHCTSVHRDTLKLIQRQWAEVRILCLALGASLIAWGVALRVFHLEWFPVLIAMVTAAILVQLVGASLVLVKAFNSRASSDEGGT